MKVTNYSKHNSIHQKEDTPFLGTSMCSVPKKKKDAEYFIGTILTVCRGTDEKHVPSYLNLCLSPKNKDSEHTFTILSTMSGCSHQWKIDLNIAVS